MAELISFPPMRIGRLSQNIREETSILRDRVGRLMRSPVTEPCEEIVASGAVAELQALRSALHRDIARIEGGANLTGVQAKVLKHARDVLVDLDEMLELVTLLCKNAGRLPECPQPE